MDDNEMIIVLYEWIDTLMKEKKLDIWDATFRIQENLEIANQEWRDDHNE